MSTSRNQHLSGLRSKRRPYGLWPGNSKPGHASRGSHPQGSARRSASRIAGGASGSLQTGGEPQDSTCTQFDAANICSTKRRRDHRIKRTLPLLARLRHADCIEECPLSGATRKTFAHTEFFSVCEGFRMTAHHDDSACTGAVVRKPPVKERA